MYNGSYCGRCAMLNLKRHIYRLFSYGKGRQLVVVTMVCVVVASLLCLVGQFCIGVDDSGHDGWEQALAIFFSGNFLISDSMWPFRLIAAILSIFLFSAILVSSFTNVLDNIAESVRTGQARYKMNHHVVILGSGKKLPHILKLLAAENKDVVVMCSEEPEVEGKYVYYFGKRDNRDDLAGAYVEKADAIYVIGEDGEMEHDNVSIRCLELLRELCADAQHDIHCYLTIESVVTQEVFQYYRSKESGRLFLVDVINENEYYAEQLMTDTDFLPVIRSEENRGCVIVLLGDGECLQSIAYTAAHLCHYPSYTEYGRKTIISFVGNGKKELLSQMVAARPALFEMSEYKLIEPDGKESYHKPECKDILDVCWEFVDSPVESSTSRSYVEKLVLDSANDVRVIVCENDDSKSMRTILHLPRSVYKIPRLAVFLNSSKDLLDRAVSTGMYGNVMCLGPAAEHDDALFLNRSRRGRIVNYIYEQEYGDKMLSENESWYKASEMNKFSSIYCANAMVLRKKCYDLTSPDRKWIYESEHRRWMMSVLLMGQSYGDVTDKIHFIHSDIAPYDELPESEQVKDKILIDKFEEICK